MNQDQFASAFFAIAIGVNFSLSSAHRLCVNSCSVCMNIACKKVATLKERLLSVRCGASVVYSSARAGGVVVMGCVGISALSIGST